MRLNVSSLKNSGMQETFLHAALGNIMVCRTGEEVLFGVRGSKVRASMSHQRSARSLRRGRLR